jgi:Flp pilus assembly pilin Flp
MGVDPPTPSGTRPTFSPDGLWWWDGAQWRPAVSPDGRWLWDGRGWVPAGPARLPQGRAGGGAGMAVIITIAAFGGILVLVALVTLAILYTMGSQISNVFSNVVAALGATPSP